MKVRNFFKLLRKIMKIVYEFVLMIMFIALLIIGLTGVLIIVFNIHNKEVENINNNKCDLDSTLIWIQNAHKPILTFYEGTPNFPKKEYVMVDNDGNICRTVCIPVTFPETIWECTTVCYPMDSITREQCDTIKLK